MPHHQHNRKAWLPVVTLVVVLAFAFQGSRGLWETDEGRYVRCAYEMLKTGNWLVPTIDGNPHFSKPPLAYWVIASGLRLFGMNEWGARMFHGLFFVLTALTIGWLGARMWHQEAGLLACLIYATMLLPYASASIITSDAILMFFETLAMACFWASLGSPAKRRHDNIWAALMFSALGLAFLTKGPPGLLPLLAMIVYLIAARKSPPYSLGSLVLGLGVFAIIAVPWYMVVIKKYEGLAAYFLTHEVLGRVATGEHSRNPGLRGLFVTYVPVLLFGALPWICCWPMIARRISRPIALRSRWRRLQQRPQALFLVVWFAIPLLVLCLAQSRLPLYLLPLCAPLALMTARSLIQYFPEQAAAACLLKGKIGAAVVAFTVLLLSIKVVLAIIPSQQDNRAMWNGIQQPIQERIRDAPYEIVLVEENFNGLAFYSGADVEYVKIKEQNRPTFVPWEHVDEELDEISSEQGQHKHVLLVREKHQEDEAVLAQLRQRGMSHEVVQAPFKHKLIFIKPAPIQGAGT